MADLQSIIITDQSYHREGAIWPSLRLQSDYRKENSRWFAGTFDLSLSQEAVFLERCRHLPPLRRLSSPPILAGFQSPASSKSRFLVGHTLMGILTTVVVACGTCVCARVWAGGGGVFGFAGDWAKSAIECGSFLHCFLDCFMDRCLTLEPSSVRHTVTASEQTFATSIGLWSSFRFWA